MNHTPTDEGIKTDEDKSWYYSIEVSPGEFTAGHDHPSVAVTRNLLRQIRYANSDCLDIGTQEAIIPILLKKGGAKWVVAYDRRDLTSRISDLRRLYDAEFDYVAGCQLTDLPSLLDGRGGRFFDLVVFSGVLYHMINPLGLLGLVRGFCKMGGLFLIETMAFQEEEMLLRFNAKGRYGGGSNYFAPTTMWLDYVLRLLALRPISVSYLRGEVKGAPHRVAVLCRSESAPCPLDTKDSYISGAFHERAFRNEFQLDWPALRQTASDIGFRAEVDHMNGSIYDAIRKSSPYALRPEELRLSFSSSM